MPTEEEMDDLSEEAKMYVERLFPKSFEFDYSDTKENQMSKLDLFLKEKYGFKTFNDYSKIRERLRKAKKERKKERIRDELRDFGYRIGISDDLEPQINSRTKSMLEFMLIRQKFQKGDYEIVDLMCGNGMVDIGLSLGLPNIRRIHSIDKSGSAIYRLRKNIEDKLSGDEKKIARKKINPLILNSESNEIFDFIESEVRGPVIFYNSCTQTTYRVLSKCLRKIGIGNAAAFIFVEREFDDRIYNFGKDEEDSQRIFAIQNNEALNYYGSSYGLEFDLIGCTEHVPYLMLSFSKGKINPRDLN